MIVMTDRGIELEIRLNESGAPTAARVNHQAWPPVWFPVPKGTGVEQAKTCTRGMNMACWRAGYEALARGAK